MKKILKAYLIGLMLILFVITAVYAGVGPTGAKVVDLQQDIYRLIDMVYAEVGIAPPSGSRPWSIDEWDMHIARLEGRNLSPAGSASLRYIKEELDHSRKYLFSWSDSSHMNLGLQLAFEGYAHTNLDDFPDEQDWVYNYTHRKGLAKAEMELSLSEWFYLYMDLEYRKNRFIFLDEESHHASEFAYNYPFSTNIFNAKYVDFETPYRAFLSFGSGNWNLAAGRDNIKWGHGKTGNLIIHNHLDYHELFRFTAFHEHIKFETSFLFFDHPDFTDKSEVKSPGVKMFLGHRLELRPFEWLSFSVTENVMYQHEYLEPRYLNPAYIYHNLNNRSMFNAIASLEIEISPLPGITGYYQFALDQARAPFESDTQPDTWAHLIGYTAVFPVSEGYAYHNGEFVYLSPYMYHRDLVDFVVMRRQFIIGYSYETVKKFIGHPDGSDAAVLYGQVGYTKPGVFDVSLDLRYRWKGEIGLDEDISNAHDFQKGLTTPTGIVEHTFQAGVGGSYFFSRALQTYARVDYLSMRNKGNFKAPVVWDMQFILGITYSL